MSGARNRYTLLDLERVRRFFATFKVLRHTCEIIRFMIGISKNRAGNKKFPPTGITEHRPLTAVSVSTIA
jgi:hypothetical protein